MTISLCMIVRNEAPRIAACLDAARGAVDEMVIVDTGSTDGTAALAARLGARVHEWPWRDDFAAARNESLRLAHGAWALVLDADERLAPGAVPLVRAAVGSGLDGVDCQLVSALPPGQPAPTIAAWYCRLFRRASTAAFEGRIHEQIAPSILRAGGAIGRSEIVIHHEGYAQPNAAKLARNLRLIRLELDERPDHAFTLLNLGLTLQAAGEWPTAAVALQRALASKNAPLARGLRAVAWTHLAEGCLRNARTDEAARAASAALDEEPSLHVARYVLGRALFDQDRFEDAEAQFQAIGPMPDALGMTLHPYLGAVGRGLCLLRRRRFEDAVAAIAPAADSDPTGEAAFHLGNAWLGLHRVDHAGQAYEAARARGFQHPDLTRRRALCARLGGHLITA